MGNTAIRLRRIGERDIPALEELEQECFSDPWSGRLLRGLLGSDLDETWVLEAEGGRIAGYANFRFIAGEGELMRIAVGPEFRGRGYSRKLMECLVKSAEEQGVLDLTLEVRSGNQTALNLYKSYGFKEEAVRKGYYRNPTEDAVIMWRRNLLGITT